MTDPIRLSADTLDRLPDDVRRPSYDRTKLSAGIVHIGLGNFHRAHQAWYLHRLMDEGLAHDWAILGAGVRAPDAARRDVLLAQDCLNTLIELDPSGKSAEVTGSMIGFVAVEDGNAALIAAMADPAIRIVSLTVTEGGYFQNASGGFDTDHPDIRHDAEHPDTPRTAFGAMIAALRLRRDAGHGPFTCLSCDNLQGNGDVLARTVRGLARLVDPELAKWIEETCTFPNSMVDCIVPATGESELALVRDFGIADNAPVTHENFRQWVIEDKFCAGRPDWDRAGATFTDDVHAFEAMKIRLLNGGHQIIANPGEILGIETIHGTMEHEGIRATFQKIEREEIAPHVAPVPDMDPDRYIELISTRFANPEIRDTTRRVAFDGSSRHTGFLVPVIRDAIEAGTPVEGLALAEALWARMCEGTRENGTEIAPNDPLWGDLQKAARAAKDDPAAWLEQRRFYGDIGADPRFAKAFAAWLSLIWSEGTEAALDRYARST
ncbi:mannitol dehydrogenase family protein [Palleronia sp. LCG004]|uniref:mannitol dehydrogenase family protein n=1 Tax=Palleronia sp. LCG004 TaxID=3079304 RepID=UPI002942E5ED|nr:mannitol dehydrogenase family protein [Palleronia sp. LCG004]WOI57679.1 mannitol dehydrogenase family protein [Palleronia sp. LCG004]